MASSSAYNYSQPLPYSSSSYGEPQPLPRHHQPLASSYPPQHGHPGEERIDLDNDREDLLAEDEKDEKLVDWGKMFTWRMWARKKWIPYYIGLIICAVLVVFMTIYHKEIIKWLQKPAKWMKDLPAGWTIPVAILFVISWPPLFGHEVVAILCGVVWPIWEAFGIVCLGTFLGELGNFFGFKYCLRSTAQKLENKDLAYACMAKVVRDGGLPVALVARFSAIPGHFTTAVFSTVGMNVWIFTVGVILSFPKQLITVYLGTVLNDTTADTKSRWISNSVLVVSFLVTVWAAWWLWQRMDKVRPEVLKERRRLEKLKLNTRTSSSYPPFSSTIDLQGKSEIELVPVKESYQTTNDLPYNQTSDAFNRGPSAEAGASSSNTYSDPYGFPPNHHQVRESSAYTYSNPQPYCSPSTLPHTYDAQSSSSRNRHYQPSPSPSPQPAQDHDRYDPHLPPQHPTFPTPTRSPSPQQLPTGHQAPSDYPSSSPSRSPMPAAFHPPPSSSSPPQAETMSIDTTAAAPPYSFVHGAEELTPTLRRPTGSAGVGLTDGGDEWRGPR